MDDQLIGNDVTSGAARVVRDGNASPTQCALRDFRSVDFSFP
jgi:hypothetical protein